MAKEWTPRSMVPSHNRVTPTTPMIFRNGHWCRIADPGDGRVTLAVAQAALGVTASAPVGNRNTAASVRQAFGL